MCRHVKLQIIHLLHAFTATYIGRVQLKCDGTRWRTGGEEKWKLANGVDSQYSSHYPGTLLKLMRTPRLPVVDWTDAPRRFKWTRPVRRKKKSGFCVCAITDLYSSQLCRSRDCVVGIATRYGLEVPGIESRWGTRSSAPVQTDPGAHPPFHKMGTKSFPGVKRPGRGVDHPPQSSAEVKERVGLCRYSPSGPSWFVIGWTLPLPLLHNFVV